MIRTSSFFLSFRAQAIRGDDITVNSYKLESRITSRFAHTTVRSSVVNSGSKAQSIGFNVQIPKRAFISNFTMWAEFHAVHLLFTASRGLTARFLLQERQRDCICGFGEREDSCQELVLPGQSPREGRRDRQVGKQPVGFQASAELSGVPHAPCSPLYRANSLDMETFKTEVHVPPGSNIEFELHYQELMSRKLGMYDHSLYLQPGRLVPNFQVRRSPGGFPYAYVQSCLTSDPRLSLGGRPHLWAKWHLLGRNPSHAGGTVFRCDPRHEVQRQGGF